jgi:hypothetical protein
LKRLINLNILVSESFRLKVLSKICCKRIRTRPTPNSIAEKMRKKKVRESIFKLSYANPTNRTIAYNVIQSNSAVSNKCKAVLVLINKLPKIRKNSTNKVFRSPKNKIT